MECPNEPGFTSLDRNSTKQSKPGSVSPCGAQICVDDVSESEDLDHSAQPSASCGTDGDRRRRERRESGVRAPKRVQDPRVSTQAEVDEHNLTHLPYRSWCTHCVRGRGKAHPHRESGDEERHVPELHVDCCIMGKVDREGPAHSCREGAGHEDDVQYARRGKKGPWMST